MRLRSLPDLLAPAVPDPEPAPSLAARGILGVVLCALWPVDLLMSADAAGAAPALAALVPAGLALLGPRDRTAARAWIAVLCSLACSALIFARGAGQDAPGLTELVALSMLLVSSARRVPSAAAALGACTGLALALVMLGTRASAGSGGMVLAVLLLTPVAAAATVLGAYLRSSDSHRRRTLDRAQRDALLGLAGDLHDSVAHHVTGIVVLAQAGRTIWETSPEAVAPIFGDIEQAGNESLDSMRQVIAMLGEDPGHASLRPPQGITHIPALVESFQRGGPAIGLDLDEAVLDARLAPGVVTTVHRVIIEGLGNVRRHAPDAAPVTVRVALHPDRLEAAVHNGPSGGTRKRARGRQGAGLLRLRERVRAVGGSLTARPDGAGGWELTALLPVPGARHTPR